MKSNVFILLFVVGCSQLPKTVQPRDEVTILTALDQAQMSYLKGCTEAMVALKQPSAFDGCREKARLHRLELNEIIFQNVRD